MSWKKDYTCEYLYGNTRGAWTEFKHPLGYTATHDSARQNLIIRDENRRQVTEDHRLMDADQALSLLNQDYD